MADARPISLGEYLLREGVVTQAQYNAALAKQRKNGLSLGRILVDSDLITEDMRISVLKSKFGFSLAEIEQGQKIDPLVLTIIPYSFAEKHRAVPIRQDQDKALVVAMEDPSDLLIVDAIKNQVGMKVKTVIGKRAGIQAVLAQYEAQTNSEEEARELRRAGDWHNGIFYKIVKYGAFPVFALAPLVLFFVALYTDYQGLAKTVQNWMTQTGTGTFDLILYFLLSWGLWSIVLFEINGLIFGNSKPEDEL